MTRILLAAFLAPTLLASSPSWDNARGSGARSRLTLRIYNYADVSPDILKRSKREATRLFERAGVETAWLDCPTAPQQLAENRACAGQSGPIHLVLNLLPSSMSEKYGFKRGIFGFALPTAKGRPGTKISLFFERVLDLAYYGGVGTSFEGAQAIILGHMIVHEVGHLMLGPNSHSSSGVMSFPWDKRTLTNMERGRLKFTTSERSRIHKDLERRSDWLQAQAN